MFFTELILPAFTDALLDSVRTLPFLFAAFLLLEALEHCSLTFVRRLLTKIGKAGPLCGAILGCIPQCGFSVMAANLYAGGILSPGTLIAIFLSTSDEALLILPGQPDSGRHILYFLLAKITVGVLGGYITDLFLASRIATAKKIDDLCADCGCHDHHGILHPALNHTLKLFLYVLVLCFALNIVMEQTGPGQISAFLLSGSILQPFLTALIGLIPNCAASVLLTELYAGGALPFSSAAAGLSACTGVGLVLLFRTNRNTRENLKITGLLYVFSVLFGLLLHVLPV